MGHQTLEGFSDCRQLVKLPHLLWWDQTCALQGRGLSVSTATSGRPKHQTKVPPRLRKPPLGGDEQDLSIAIRLGLVDVENRGGLAGLGCELGSLQQSEAKRAELWGSACLK